MVYYNQVQTVPSRLSTPPFSINTDQGEKAYRKMKKRERKEKEAEKQRIAEEEERKRKEKEELIKSISLFDDVDVCYPCLSC